MTSITDECLILEVEEAAATTSILIVDDDASVRTSLRRLLQALGYDAVGAANGSEALHKAAEIVPDLIIMDLHLMHESGVDAARAIKSVTTLKHIPIVAMTSTGVDSDELRATFKTILRKPFGTTQIQAVLELFLLRSL